MRRGAAWRRGHTSSFMSYDVVLHALVCVSVLNNNIEQIKFLQSNETTKERKINYTKYVELIKDNIKGAKLGLNHLNLIHYFL